MMEADLSMSSGVVKAIFDVTKGTTLLEIAKYYHNQICRLIISRFFIVAYSNSYIMDRILCSYVFLSARSASSTLRNDFSFSSF